MRKKGQEGTPIEPEPSTGSGPKGLRCKKVTFQLQHRQNLSSAFWGRKKKKQKPGKRVGIREKINIPKQKRKLRSQPIDDLSTLSKATNAACS